ncbi:hypothetical protein HANVADRAFT_52950 [Hanseniaspora valbyensis NRRL Y-1626]|uniref:FAD-binding FR-type domain-containing protein n=1 Tax=Hanseniaspora valbyensis NRRL Y-1626 TaxID=766949 RepID=A0A1B7TD49_9ASCO|nr:hypothetical protein HANVADRAFT_52950 [Hanseniaspora valbyensis NRRL Y-1626]
MLKTLFKKGNTSRLSFFKFSLIGVSTISVGVLSYSYYKKYQWEQSKTELSQQHFVKYKINWRNFIDKDHFLLEVESIKPQKVNSWKENGYKKLWSVEVKQPQIHVVRNYTPLPLKHVNSNENNEDDFSLKVIQDDASDNGKLMFYIKKYDNGEVARWLSKLPIGHELELRGPYIDYEFPLSPEDEIILDTNFLNSKNRGKEIDDKTKYKQFDINFFTGGTGIVTPLQLVLTQDPFKGKIQIIHACNDYKKGLKPLLPLIDKLENQNRLKLHYFEDFRNELKKGKNLNKIIEKPYSFVGFNQINDSDNDDDKIKPIFSLVVGPDGFIENVCGPKFDLHQGPITGFLGKKGWDNDNVFKLS